MSTPAPLSSNGQPSNGQQQPQHMQGINWSSHATPAMPRMIPVRDLERGMDISWDQHSRQQQNNTWRPSQFASSLLAEGFTIPTVQSLEKNGFTSKDLLALLRKDDIADLAIEPLAQRRLLERYLDQQEGPSPSAAAAVTSPAQAMHPVMSSLGGLLSSQSQETSGNNSYMPPFAIQGGKKHLDITDYVRCFTPLQDERVLASADGDMQFLIRGSGKPKLEDVSPLTWMGASVRIMRELIKRGELAVSDIDKYLTYMEKVADLSAKYTWASLRTFDREFRRWQAQTGVSWMQDNSHLSDAYLYVRQDPKPSGQADKKMNNKSRPKTEQGTHQGTQQGTQQVCRLYNYGECRFGSSCQFQHRCMVPGCTADHAIVNHGSKSKNG
jgi:hypothetical protein